MQPALVERDAVDPLAAAQPAGAVRDDPAGIARAPGPAADWPELGLPDYRQYAVPVGHFEMIDHVPTLEAVEAVEAVMAELDGAAS
ncbi:hypothetical protein HET69_07130 [Streptomyces sp. CJ_13]|uniref:hypothetical protein n=1 Tax=Streptomyces sp. CJ_13 TaxID=2724943 RepID=UPI001BDC60CF|nr:hypothetical protein [Streptomyces sp. CJ_13]MBT1183795.1 hypothetical protein [Streptomyces sp. CJ_13]